MEKDSVTNDNACAICGEGVTTNVIELIDDVPLHYRTCDTCHSDYATVEDSRKNKLNTTTDKT